jgi:HEAT repeat protein
LFILTVLGSSAVAMAQATRPAYTWLDSVDAGYIEAQNGQRPVLVVVSDDRFGSAYDKAMADAKVAAKLAGWVLVRLGPQERDARQALGVAGAPALRALTPAGRVIARLDGVVGADGIVKWLEAAAEAATPPKLDGADVKSLVALLASPDATVREAATRQLMGKRDESAAAVVETLASSNATARIAAADLLEEWAAPIDGIDPWQRATVTPERLATLKTWASNPVAPTTAPSQPYNEAVASADLDALLAAGTSAEARAIRERLVRYGEAVMPQVLDRLRSARTPEARQRLTALRYRLAATDSFAAGWPGGFDRLASADGFVRRGALDELATRAKAGDDRLLLELFGDDDSVVREKALALLKSVGGDSRALVKLLADPEPNVRAAVLKSLATGDNEAADPALAPDLAKYIATEKDADLLVHAIHVLKSMPGDPALAALKALLANPEWRVRAEAAEALREKVGNYRANLSDEAKTQIYLALIKLLDDEEGFVVAKAVAALSRSQLTTAVDPMLKTITRRPDMAVEILKAIGDDRTTAAAALPELKKLAKDPKPEVRATAIKAIITAAPGGSGTELKAALADADERVRAAGVEGVLAAMEHDREEATSGRRSTFGTNASAVDPAKWLDNYRSGKGRPKWLGEMAPTLEKLAIAEKPPTSLQAGVALCGLGKEDVVLPQLYAAVKTDDREPATVAMAWLPWEKRQAMFTALMAASPAGERETIVRAFAKVPDPRGAEELWAMLKADGQSSSVIDPMHDALRTMYFGEDYYNMDRVSASAKKSAREAVEKYAGEGNHLHQRTVALVLAMTLDQELAGKLAEKVPAADPLGPVALQIRLVATDSEEDGNPIAVEAMKNPATRQIAVRYLAGGESALGELNGIYLSTSSSRGSYGNDLPKVEPPAGVKMDDVRGVVNDPNPDTAGYAGYLVVLLGDASGFKPLEAAWRKHGGGDTEWTRLVYRAIAKMNDDTRTPLLEEIYGTYKTSYELREYYWTIRSMKGDNVLKLRKKIRDEVGMDRLK